jgi:hypothetical protein
MVEDDDDLQGTSREGVTTTGTQSTPTIAVSPSKDEGPPERTVTPPPTPVQLPLTPERPQVPLLIPPAPRRTARTSRPTWKKQAYDEEKARKEKGKEQRWQEKEKEKEKEKDKAPDLRPDEDTETIEPTAEQELINLAYQAAYGLYIPSSYEEAMRSPYADEWVKVMKEELEMLKMRNTWVEENLPPGWKEVGCRWVYDLKFNANGNIIRWKA